MSDNQESKNIYGDSPSGAESEADNERASGEDAVRAGAAAGADKARVASEVAGMLDELLETPASRKERSAVPEEMEMLAGTGGGYERPVTMDDAETPSFQRAGGSDPASASAASGNQACGTTGSPAPGYPAGNPVCCPAVAAFLQERLARKSWRRRHPFLFVSLLLLTLVILLNIGAAVVGHLHGKGAFSGPRFGIIRLEGMIINSTDIVNWSNELSKDRSVAGVLLYINSPGGAVVPSQEIHAAVKRLAASKPVVVYMSSTAASGGYYAAVAGDYIVASPSTLTGSIGVRMDLTEMQELFDTLGIRSQSLSSGPFKESGTPFRPMRDDERAYLQGIVQDMYECFIEDIAKGREIPLEAVRAVADGRAFTGRQALALSLVDELGDIQTAWNALLQRSELEAFPTEFLDGPPKKKSFVQELITGAVRQLEGEALKSRNPMPGFYY